MAEQQHKSTKKSSETEDQVDETEIDAARKEKLDDDVDSILDDIDDVLEENAEEFVKQYVQKGGE